jgi:hypothetical protein
MIKTHLLFLFSYSNKFNGMALINIDAKITKKALGLQLKGNTYAIMAELALIKQKILSLLKTRCIMTD